MRHGALAAKAAERLTNFGGDVTSVGAGVLKVRVFVCKPKPFNCFDNNEISHLVIVLAQGKMGQFRTAWFVYFDRRVWIY